MKRLGIAAVASLALSALAPVASAGADGASCDHAVNNTFKKLLRCVTLDGAREHQRVFQDIADDNDDIRQSGTPGYDESADYAEGVLREAGYAVTRQEFKFVSFRSNTDSVLEQVDPAGGPIENNIMSYSGSGDVTADVSTVDAPIGCEAADFKGFTAGDIALISRGTCAFAVKATNADAAGASGVIIYNNAEGVLNGTLGSDFALDIPVTAVTMEEGQRLIGLVADGLRLRLATDTTRSTVTTSNVIAETERGDPDNVVMIGAHLDSVPTGPGIQDNGTGSAAILEVAQAFAKVKPVNKVRFALWGAEESGLVGSTEYVAQLTEAETKQIALYLNFDMIGSPNHVLFIYDGDDSDQVGAGPGPDGSAAIERLFESYYTQIGESYKGTDFSGRSDYGPFIEVGVPSGGLFTGAEEIKTDEEARIWGGEAGEAYDPCYHLACDTYDNINLHAFDVNLDAVAYGVLSYAYSTEPVNGVKGKKVPGSKSIGSGKRKSGHQGRAGDSVHDHDHRRAG